MREEYLPFGRPNFSDEEIEAVSQVIRSGWIGMGPETIAFEQEIAEFTGAKHIVAVNSCTSALFLALLVSDVGPGDEVICPSLTWCSTANVVLYLGATPVFCDVDPDTLCVSPETITEKLTKRTTAVMVVHFGGLAVDVGALRKTLPDSVKIIEDAAHALGARYSNGKQVGSSGNMVCYSFYANKNLSTGEGGAVALDNTEMMQRIRSLRQHALPLDAWKRFTHANSLMLSNNIAELGYKMNYTDLNAAIGRIQLKRFKSFEQRRRQIAEIYIQGLKHLSNGIKFQTGCISEDHARHLFVVQIEADKLNKSRDEILLALRGMNVGASIHYAPLHTMPLYTNDAIKIPSLPVTEKVTAIMLTLPISASMTVEDAEYVVNTFKEVVSCEEVTL